MKNSASKNKFLFLALIATLVAIGVHIYLTMHYYGLKFGTTGGTSVCNINEVLNCDAVSASKYSALFGVPLALWAAVTNFVLLYFLAVTRFNLVQDPAKTSRYAFLLSGVTIIATLVMGSISFTLMSNLCVFCIATYILSIIGFIGTWLGAEDLSIGNLVDDIKDVFTTEKWVGGFLVAIPVISFAGNIMYLESHGLSGIEKVAKEKIAYWQVAPQHTFDLSAGLVLQKGSGEPVMTLVEFADFRCPHCKYAAPSLHAFVKSHPDVKFVFKPFPLDGTCNEAIRGGGDGISCGLASAVMCAEKMAQKGWAAHEYFFENQEAVIRSGNLDKNLEELSQATDLSLEELKNCVKDPTTQELIRKMAKEGETAQIQGTPTVFANGKLLNGGQLLPILEAAYRSLQK